MVQNLQQYIWKGKRIMIEILNEDCDVTLSTLDKCVDVILTSPPYNTGRELTSERARNNHEARYDIYLDNKTNDEYCDWVSSIAP